MLKSRSGSWRATAPLFSFLPRNGGRNPESVWSISDRLEFRRFLEMGAKAEAEKMLDRALENLTGWK
jgi:hypothetical protein